MPPSPVSPGVPEPPAGGAPQTVTIVPFAYIGPGTVFVSPAESVIPLCQPRPSSGAAMTASPPATAVLSYSSTSTEIRAPGGMPPISPCPSDRRNHLWTGAKWGARTRIRILSEGCVGYDGARVEGASGAAPGAAPSGAAAGAGYTSWTASVPSPDREQPAATAARSSAGNIFTDHRTGLHRL